MSDEQIIASMLLRIDAIEKIIKEQDSLINIICEYVKLQTEINKNNEKSS